MTRSALFAAPLALAAGLFALPALAFDVSAMSDAEREAFHTEVRAYLMEHPEVIMEAIQVLEERNQQQQVAADDSLVRQYADAIFDDGFSWVGGNPEGDVTVVEFLDYRCGYCRKAFEEVKKLVEADGNIRFIVKEFPILGQASLDSSRFAVAARQASGDAVYEQLHDALMAYKGATDLPALTRLAEDLDIDPAPILAQLDAPEVDAEIRKTHELAKKLKVNGTPTFVFDTQMVRGYVPLDVMEQIVSEEREG
ncbi:DsbA family protein [Pseudooceanicola sp. C21-150M6]|uniref:DsbA family protein n=1 Tax=Pseudooceanicola sp. C21-150M6 TaxID=3434355 RepID=UPI003D7F9847